MCVCVCVHARLLACLFAYQLFSQDRISTVVDTVQQSGIAHRSRSKAGFI